MSAIRKNQIVLPENSTLLQSFALGLLLLSFFIALSAYREPNSIKRNKVLRSIATNFRNSNSVKVDKNKLNTKLSVDLSQSGLVKLSGLISIFFTPDSSIVPEMHDGIVSLARQVSLTNASLEIYCHSAASGVSQATAYQKLAETEARCERIAEIFRLEGVPNFNIVSRVGFKLNSDEDVQLQIRGESFRSSWE